MLTSCIEDTVLQTKAKSSRNIVILFYLRATDTTDLVMNKEGRGDVGDERVTEIMLVKLRFLRGAPCGVHKQAYINQPFKELLSQDEFFVFEVLKSKTVLFV